MAEACDRLDDSVRTRINHRHRVVVGIRNIGEWRGESDGTHDHYADRDETRQLSPATVWHSPPPCDWTPKMGVSRLRENCQENLVNWRRAVGIQTGAPNGTTTADNAIEEIGVQKLPWLRSRCRRSNLSLLNQCVVSCLQVDAH